MRETASIKDRQAGNCGSLCDRQDITEKGARSTSEASVRPATIATSWAWVVAVRVHNIREAGQLLENK